MLQALSRLDDSPDWVSTDKARGSSTLGKRLERVPVRVMFVRPPSRVDWRYCPAPLVGRRESRGPLEAAAALTAAGVAAAGTVLFSGCRVEAPRVSRYLTQPAV